jgi:hypothetical protein
VLWELHDAIAEVALGCCADWRPPKAQKQRVLSQARKKLMPNREATWPGDLQETWFWHVFEHLPQLAFAHAVYTFHVQEARRGHS